MACPNCSRLENLYGFHLERNTYYMTQVNEIKKCCPSKVYVTDFTSTDVTFTCNGKEFKMKKQDFYKSSWRLYDSY